MDLVEMWEEIHEHVEWGNTGDSFLKEFLEQHKFYGNALDLGCGVGANCGLLLNHGLEVWAVDCSETAIEKTKRNYVSDKLHTSVVNFEDMTFPNKFFDLVISIVSIEQLLDFHKIVNLIQNIRHWLRPDGTFYLKLLCEPIDHDLLRAPVHLTTQEDLAQLMDGFAYNVFGCSSTVECGAVVSHWVISATPHMGNLRLLPKPPMV